ncbi:copper resistance CopC family protein [Glycomyces paridis]|uniref:Copper resistance protein CopC n=1 Tax=Glycomyces paridis TaxID=2126555 RepID=A0A4S8PHN5_9ACTN|nr:copper resistance CopC family protein [Glycomyces paridis]THV30090.1 copper resistance protein CopC [Glycomyces paridis]
MQRTPARRAVPLLLAALLGGALALGSAAPASAHAALVSTDPEDGAVLAEAPAEVSATFSELLDGPSTEIAVTDPSGAVVAVADPSFDGDTFTLPMLYTTAGEYTVAFRVISEDGHRVDGQLAFTVESIPEGLYAPGSEPTALEEAPSSEAPEASDSEAAATTAAAADSDGDDEESNTGATLAAILLGLLVIVVVGVVLVKTLGRKGGHDETDAKTDES